MKNLLIYDIGCKRLSLVPHFNINNDPICSRKMVKIKLYMLFSRLLIIRRLYREHLDINHQTVAA